MKKLGAMTGKSIWIFQIATSLAIFGTGIILGMSIFDTKYFRDSDSGVACATTRRAIENEIRMEFTRNQDNSKNMVLKSNDPKMDSNEEEELLEILEELFASTEVPEVSEMGSWNESKVQDANINYDQGRNSMMENSGKEIDYDNQLMMIEVIEEASQDSIEKYLETTILNDSDKVDQVPKMFAEIHENLFANFPKLFISHKTEQLNWFEALQACAKMDMELVSITNDDENREVEIAINRTLDLNNEEDSGNDFWTAGTNLWSANQSKFYWATTGRQISGFTNWHQGNPNFPEEQHCIEITKEIDAESAGTYKWNDYGCHIRARYICKQSTVNIVI